MARYEQLTVGELEIDKLGMGGVAPASQVVKIADPTGGATTDAEARAAIDLIIDALEAVGISAAV